MKINWRYYIGGWQIIGGIWGVIVLAAGNNAESTFAMVSGILVSSIAILSIVAGIALIRAWEFGRSLSIAVQAVQVTHLINGYFAYRIILGPYARLWWDLGARVGFDMGATVSARLAIDQSMPGSVALNLVSFAALLALLDLPDRPKIYSGRSAPDLGSPSA